MTFMNALTFPIIKKHIGQKGLFLSNIPSTKSLEWAQLPTYYHFYPDK